LNCGKAVREKKIKWEILLLLVGGGGGGDFVEVEIKMMQTAGLYVCFACSAGSLE
jgi:hypothetical protein